MHARPVFLFLVLALLINTLPGGSAVPPFDDDDVPGGDAGDNLEEASPVGEGLYRGTVAPVVDERDHYRLEFGTAEILSVRPYWSGPERITIHQGGFPVYTLGDEPIYLQAHPTKEWYISIAYNAFEVRGSSDSVRWQNDVYNRYMFRIQAADVPAQDDAGSGVDAGPTTDHAVTLTSGTWSADGGGYDRADTFRIDVPASKHLRVDLSATIGYLHVSGTTSDGERIDGFYGEHHQRYLEGFFASDTAVFLHVAFSADGDARTFPYTMEVTIDDDLAVADLEPTALYSSQVQIVYGHERRQVTVEVTNQGDRTSLEGAWLRLVHHRASPLPAIAPGETVAITFDTASSITTDESVRFTARVSANSRFPESDYTNNQIEADLPTWWSENRPDI